MMMTIRSGVAGILREVIWRRRHLVMIKDAAPGREKPRLARDSAAVRKGLLFLSPSICLSGIGDDFRITIGEREAVTKRGQRASAAGSHFINY
jgi:hypothetical protein